VEVRHSVIIPVFNMASTIGVQLEALCRQTLSEAWEIIVADNGSTDRTRDIVSQFSASLPITWLDASGHPHSAAYARNCGASVAAGQYLYFVDADDQVDDHWLAGMSSALREHELVGCVLEYKKLNNRRDYCEREWTLQKTSLSNEYGFLPYCWGCGIGVRRVVHEAVAGFDSAFTRLEDIDYSWRIQLQLGITPFFVPDAICHYRIPKSAHQAFLKGAKCASDERLLYKRFHRNGIELRFTSGRLGKDTAIFAAGLLRLIPSLKTKGDFLYWCNEVGYFAGTLHSSWRPRP
jgi:glycosyltransferase involved in cell wall biosynthesis